MLCMSGEAPRAIAITRSPTQIDEVLRAAADSRAPSLSTVVAAALRAPLHAADAAAESPLEGGRAPGAPGPNGHPPPHGYVPVRGADQRLSRSLLRGLSLLTCFGPGGESRGIVEMAGDLGMSPSTTHRYAVTLVELGLLERCPKTRKYRLPGTPS